MFFQSTSQIWTDIQPSCQNVPKIGTGCDNSLIVFVIRNKWKQVEDYVLNAESLIYVNILDFMPATRSKQVGTGSAKDTRVERSSGTRRWYRHWGMQQKAQCVSRRDGENFTALWETAWVNSPTVEENFTMNNFTIYSMSYCQKVKRHWRNPCSLRARTNPVSWMLVTFGAPDSTALKTDMILWRT